MSITLIVLALAGCGGGGGDSTPTTTPVSTTPPPVGTPAPTPTPTPAPPPTPAPVAANLDCPYQTGGSQSGLSFSDSLNAFTYTLSNTTANAVEVPILTFGVANTNPVGTYSGPLIVMLWAVPVSYNGTSVVGTSFGDTNLGEFVPNFIGPGAYTPNQVNGQSASTTSLGITPLASVQNPPSGQYCIVASLLEYAPQAAQCLPIGSFDSYCSVDWVQLPGSVTFK